MKKIISSLFTVAMAATAFIGCDSNSSAASSCYTTPLADGSGVDVICNAESVGQIKNDWDMTEYIPGQTYTTFMGIQKIYDKIAPDEKVLFVIRHAARTDDVSKTGHLRDLGRFQAQHVGEMLKGAEPFAYYYSGFTRTLETVENISIGRGDASFSAKISPALDGDWFVKSESVLNTFRDANGGSYPVFTAWAYTGQYAETGAFYDLGERSEELLNILAPSYANMDKYAIGCSHDLMVVPLTIYLTNKLIDLRYFEEGNNHWLNYLAGVAIIVNSANERRYIPVKGLDDGFKYY